VVVSLRLHQIPLVRPWSCPKKILSKGPSSCCCYCFFIVRHRVAFKTTIEAFSFEFCFFFSAHACLWLLLYCIIHFIQKSFPPATIRYINANNFWVWYIIDLLKEGEFKHGGKKGLHPSLLLGEKEKVQWVHILEKLLEEITFYRANSITLNLMAYWGHGE